MAECAFVPRTRRLSLQRRLFSLLPHHALSRLGGWAARRRGGAATTAFIRWFVGRYGVDLGEAAQASPAAYSSFAAFFARALRPGVRRWPEAPDAIASPVDGAVSAAGAVDAAALIQAKGIRYPVSELLAADAAPYDGGRFVTLYLRPRDYHRVHAPVAGRLVTIRHCRGRLWPVRPWAVRGVPGLFCANERLVLDFETAAGRYALVMVGALMVGGLETVVTGPVGRRRRDPACWNLEAAPREFARGAEIGRFNFGSTVILVFERGCAALDAEALAPEREVRLGESLGRLTR